MDANSREERRRALADELRALGVRPGDVLMVHASLRALGAGPGSAEDVIEALLAAVGESGTLLMPALTYATVTREHPVFDAETTPACTGALSEVFRQREGTIRSLHPTHSVCACGARARELTEAHGEDRTPVGPHSPFALLPQAGGKILMLGCSLFPNTSMHGVEELVVPPYLFSPEPVRFTLRQGEKCGGALFTVHGFAGYAQRYDRIAPHLRGSSMRKGRVGAADCFLLDARTLWAEAETLLRGDPFYFVERLEGCGNSVQN